MIQLTYILPALFFSTLQPSVYTAEPVVQSNRVMETGEYKVLPGVVRPTSEVTLSTSFDSLLGELRVEEGQVVSQGQIVAILDDRVTRAAFRVAETQAKRTAKIDRAQAALENAEDALNRIRIVRDLNAATEPEVFAAEIDLKTAAADLRNAKEDHAEALASLELARARLEEHMVRAPFDGVIVRVHAKPGAMVSPGSPLVELVSEDGLCVDIYLPVSIAAGLHKGEHYALAFDDPMPAIVTGCVRYVESRIDPVSRTMRVVFDLEQAEHAPKLYAGVLVRPATHLPSMDAQQQQTAAAVRQP